MDVLFRHQVCPIILCGSAIVVRVMPGAGLYGEEGLFFVVSLGECGSSTPARVLLVALEGSEGSLFLKPDVHLTAV